MRSGVALPLLSLSSSRNIDLETGGHTMYVKDLMTAHPITVPLDMPVIEAKQLMARMRFRHLLVVDGTRLAGIVTDRDIKLNMPSPATSLSVWEVNYLLARL